MPLTSFRAPAASAFGELGAHPSPLARIARHLDKLPAGQQAALASFVERGLLDRLGWLESAATGRPVDAAGEPLPWLTYPALRLIEERVPGGAGVIEFGAGLSTLWWARRARRLVTIENDEGWCAEIRSRAPSHVDVRHVPLPVLGSTLDAMAASGETFDIVVIDNFDRATVAMKVMAFLHAASVIVFDNSDELVYRPCVDHLKGEGFKELRLHALGPVNPFEWSTSFLYRPGNCLGL